jgi:hypothetical protein
MKNINFTSILLVILIIVIVISIPRKTAYKEFRKWEIKRKIDSEIRHANEPGSITHQKMADLLDEIIENQ